MTIDEALEKLRDPTVTELNLKHSFFSAGEIKRIAEALPHSQVTHLTLGLAPPKSEGIQYILEALPHSQITRLGLSSCGVKAEGVKQLAEALSHSKVTDLDLSHNTLEAEGIAALAKALPKSEVTSLNLYGSRIRIEGAIILADILPQSKITSLNVGVNELYGNGVAVLAAALPHSKIASLMIGQNFMGDEGALALAKAVPHSALTSLDLNANEIGSKGGMAIANAVPRSKLTSLNVYYNKMGDEVITRLAGALLYSPITSLNVGSNGLSTTGKRSLARVLPHSQLTSLDLWGSPVYRDEGIRALIEALPHSQLVSFDASGNDLTSHNIGSLMEAIHHSSLVELSTANNGGFEREHHSQCKEAIAENILLAQTLAKNLANKTTLSLEDCAELQRMAPAVAKYLREEHAMNDAAIEQVFLGVAEQLSAHELANAKTFALRVLPLDTVCRWLKEKNTPLTIHEFLNSNGGIPQDRFLCLGGFPALFAQEDLWESKEQITAAARSIKKILLSLLDLGEARARLKEIGVTLTIQEFLNPEGAVIQKRFLYPGDILSLFVQEDLWESHEQITVAAESVKKAILQLLPLGEACAWLKEKDVPLTMKDDFLTRDGKIPQHGFLCQGGIPALFAQEELWESKTQVNKALRSLTPEQRASVHNVHTLLARVSSRSHAVLAGPEVG